MKNQILDQLFKQGLISDERLTEITERLKNKKESIDSILAELQVPAEKIVDIKSELYNLPRWVGENPSLEMIKNLSEDSSKHYKMIYLGENPDQVLLGVLDPDQSGIKDAASFLASAHQKGSYIFFILSYLQYNDYLGMYSGKSIGKVSLGEVSDSIQKKSKDPNAQHNEIDDSVIVQLVRDIVSEAIKKGASDIHIEPGSTTMKVRYRVDGELVVVRELPISNHMAIIARIKILSNLKLDEKRKPQDGHFSVDYEGRKIDFRVSTMPSYFGEKVVIRVLDTYKGVRDITALHLSPRNFEAVKRALGFPYGIVLISGPTGSGKTSTLYSMLNQLDKETRNIVSLEDPVEYSVPGVNQSQVAPEIGYTFASGLRSILRQDPDVIMVGEIRDKETAELAVQAALTGHLVFSTIHTNTAVSTINRLVEMGIEPYLIAPTLKLVIAQRLVKKLIPEERFPHEYIAIDGPYEDMVKKQFGDLPQDVLRELPFGQYFHNPKTNKENYAGTEGRVSVFEILEIDKEIESAITRAAAESEVFALARAKGMLTLKEDAMLKSMAGVVPFNECMSL